MTGQIEEYSNPYYKTDHNLYSPVREQFLDYLQREGTEIDDYWTGEKYRCFFRRNKDTNQSNSNVCIYYPVDSKIHPGSIITYFGDTYLILNQETTENRAYYRSDGINADVMLNTYDVDTKKEISLPCFAYDLTEIVPEGEEVLKAISGNVELMTGDNEMSRSLGINNEFYAMGNWYKIGSIYFKTGIARIGASIIQGTSTPVEYKLAINADETYTQGYETTLTANPTISGGAVINATLVWESSNQEVATITADGNVQFVGVGEVTISCYWKEHGIITTMNIEVVAEPVELKCEIIGADSMYTNSTVTYTAKFYQADGVTEDTTISPIWTIDMPTGVSNAVTITGKTGNKITLKAASGSSVVGKTVGLNLTDSEGLYHATKMITITSWL